VRVGQAGSLFHQRHNLVDHRGVLFIGSQVEHQVSIGDQFLVGTDGKAVFGGVLPGWAFFGDSCIAQGIRYIEAAVAKVESLIQSLGATAHNDNFPAAELIDAVGKLTGIHKTTFAQLLQLQAQGQGVEVVLSHGGSPL